MRKIIFITLFSNAFILGAQQVYENDDSTSLLHAFKNGKTSGQFRYYFSATDNTKHLTDYYAHALSGAFKFETTPIHKMQLGVGGSFIFNLGSSNLKLPDPETNQMNRYEIGLYDIEEPGNKYNIKRLEELYLKYQNNVFIIKAGRQFVNTPFINLQDGRMRPTGVEGLWLEANPFKSIEVEAGFITAISPRSTTRWFSPGNSIGVYPQGVNVNGVKHDYASNIKSNGIALIGIDTKIGKLNLQLWEQYAENVFNTIMLQVDYKTTLESNFWFGGIQLIRQEALNDGGNEDAAKTFFEKGGKALTFGSRAGFNVNEWKASINYNRITSKGRYLMPREWGKDPFFTFMPRERNDGFGGVHAYVIKAEHQYKKLLKSSLAVGYFNLPPVENFYLNKYSLPAYYQLNMDVRYDFKGVLKGLEAHALYVHKWNAEKNNNEQYKNIFNKVDMSLYNFIVNYSF
jgi:hypothetical protein